MTYPSDDRDDNNLQADPWPLVGPRRGVVAAVVVGAAALVGGVLAFALTAPATEGSAPTLGASAATAAPKQITRAELMQRYAELAPLDRSATPATMDDLADSTCGNISRGIDVDRMITVATEQYHANATEVLRLLVSYRCPQHLGLFK
jgi:hypothetical protein